MKQNVNLKYPQVILRYNKLVNCKKEIDVTLQINTLLLEKVRILNNRNSFPHFRR